jgi:formylglycine-generating enzyme required for sulfatase activity
VERVTWSEATAFCAALPAGGDDGVWRLPTEAEWERACRGFGHDFADDATWNGPLEGAQRAAVLEDLAWYRHNSGESTRPVGSKAANPLGLFDMLGNVFEWCADTDSAYPGEPVTDPLGRGGAARVLRGGSWYSRARNCRAASRDWDHPGIRWLYQGFRLLRGPALAEPD